MVDGENILYCPTGYYGEGDGEEGLWVYRLLIKLKSFFTHNPLHLINNMSATNNDNQTIVLTREAAIELNREKCKDPVLSYVKGEPIHQKKVADIMADYHVTSNTHTFIMTNRPNIMTFIHEKEENVRREKQRKKVLKYKKNVMSWNELISSKLAERWGVKPKHQTTHRILDTWD